MTNRRCSFIKAGGARCKRIVSEGYAYCYSHDPERSEERKRHARTAGSSGGNGRAKREASQDVAQARGYTKGLITRLLRGEIATTTAAVAFQGINALCRVVETERRIYEQDELEQRLQALERRQRTQQNTFQTRYRS